MHVGKSLTILVGTFLIPRICGFLTGKSYYVICAAVMQKKEQNRYIFSTVSIVALLIFLALDGYIFPYAVLWSIFGGVFQAVYFVVFHLLFFGWIVFLFIRNNHIRKFMAVSPCSLHKKI